MLNKIYNKKSLIYYTMLLMLFIFSMLFSGCCKHEIIINICTCNKCDNCLEINNVNVNEFTNNDSTLIEI